MVLGTTMRLRRICLLTIYVFLSALPVFAQGLMKAPRFQGAKPTAAEMLTNGSQGKDFYFCLPLNDNAVQPITAREIYVTASKNTEFVYEVPNLGYRRTFKVTALKVTTLKLGNVPMPEISESEIISPDGIRISSKDLISVYVYNGKSVSSDGYLAIPVASWGMEYMHIGYPDFNEVRNWKAGFAIVASEPNTLVTIQLRSDKYGDYAITSARTEGGRKYGARWDVTLQPGQCYLVQGDGTSRGTFDLSGSKVTANKPVGFISYHQRTMVPVFDHPGGRDHMCEMLPPTSTWGKTYVSVEYLRGGLGDIYRIVPLQDGTTVQMTNYEFNTGKKLGNKTFANLKSGDARSIGEVSITGPNTPPHTAVQGMAVWKANKPFLLMHYSCSASWDNDNNYDPFMVYVVPAEQFTKMTIFQCPDNPAYTNHNFNLIAIGDTSDPNLTTLKSIKLDNKFVYTITPSFLGNRIPGTNFFYARIPVANGPHLIQGNAAFGGDIYGYGSFDSYGWPAATAYRKLDQWDTLPPVLSRTEECGDFTYNGTELRNFKVNDTLDHVETGISDIGFVDTVNNYNYEIELLSSDGKVISDDRVPTDRKNAEMQFRLKVIDKTKDAYAFFYVVDRALNMSLDSVVWTAPKLKVVPDPINFGNVRVGTTKTMDVTITNPTDTLLRIKEIKMKDGTSFTIVHDSIPSDGLTISSGQSITVKISYTPQKEHLTSAEFDFDSLLVRESCAPFKFYVKGRGVQPHIYVEDWDAGTASVNSTRCYSTQFQGKGLIIRNTGTDTLHVSGVDRSKITDPFSLSTPTVPDFPLVIPPGGEVMLKELCFNPKEEKQYEIDVPFLSDAPKTPKDKNISNWRGESLAPGPYVIGHDWGRVRLGVTKPGRAYVGNSGRDNVECKDIRLNDPNIKDFVITAIGRSLNPPAIIRPLNTDTIPVDINFTPSVEGSLRNDIVGEFVGQGTRQAQLKGVGYIEKIDPNGAEFVTPILINTNDTSVIDGEHVIVRNASESEPLTVHWLQIDPNVDANNPNPDEFKLLTTPTEVSIAIAGTPIKVPLHFSPKDKGKRWARVIVSSNAEPPVPNPTGFAQDTVYIIGYGKVEGEPTITPLHFGKHLTCDEPEGEVLISNPATAQDLKITGISFNSGDATDFEILSPKATDFPITLLPNSDLKVKIRFKPSASRSYTTTINVDNENKFLLREVVDGEGYTVPALFGIVSSSKNVDLGKNGANVDMSIYTNSNNWNEAAITKFIATVKYNAFEMGYVDNTAKLSAAVDGSWTISEAKEDNSTPESTTLRIVASGTTPIKASDELVHFQMKLFVPDSKRNFVANLDFKAQDAVTNNDRRCVIVSTTGDSTSISGCVMDLRYVSVSSEQFAILDVTPHPATSGNVAVSYSLGFDALTKVEIVNALGDVVMTLADARLKKGVYTNTISTEALGSGMYNIRMSTGSYLFNKQFIITK